MSKASTAPITFLDRSRSGTGGLGEENADAHFSRLLGVIQLLDQMAEAPSGFDATRMSAALELLSEVIKSSVRELYPLSMKKTVDNSQAVVVAPKFFEPGLDVAEPGDVSDVRSVTDDRRIRRFGEVSGRNGYRNEGADHV